MSNKTYQGAFWQKAPLILALLFSAMLPAQNCPFCGKNLTQDNLCPDQDCHFYDAHPPEQPELCPGLMQQEQATTMMDICTSSGACAMPVIRPQGTGGLDCPWIRYHYLLSIQQCYLPLLLESCRETISEGEEDYKKLEYKPEVPLASQLEHLFNTPTNIIIQLTTHKWEGGENFERDYFYMFEINQQGDVFFLTDDRNEDTFGAEFLTPHQANKPFELVHMIENRKKDSDLIAIFYRQK